nr:autotransporter assembly complex family protein [Nitratireductor basaltis]
MQHARITGLCRARPFARTVLAASIAIAPLPAYGFELFGLRLFGKDKQETVDTIGTPQDFEVEFTVVGENDELSRELKKASTLWKDRDEPASGAGGLIAKARGDYRRILNELYANARYGGTISITINGQQASEILPDSEFPNPVQVMVRIDPGPEFVFSTARVENEAPPAGPGDEVEVADGFARGLPARSGAIIKAGRLAAEAWQQQGYAKARVAERRVVAAHDADTIDATIVLEPGRYARLGGVSVRGTERMNARFVARHTGLKPGEEYDPDDIELARERINRLGVFRSARVETAEEIGEDGILPVNVIVQERLPRRFGVGGSYSTVDGLGLEAYWLHRNLFGRAESLRVEGKVSGIGESIDPEDFTYRLGGTFTRPGIYLPETDFVASLYGEREVLDAYTRTGVSGEVGVTHRFTPDLSGRLFANGGWARFEDDFGTREFVTAGLLGAVTYDTRDNPADATEGIFAEVTLEPYYEFNYGNAALRMIAEARAYYSFDEEDRFVIAGRAKIGALLDPPALKTPPDKLFFAGGGGSVRGYAYRNIGVRDGENLRGGHSLAEASAELRVRITDTIGAVAFADAGYVGAEAFPDFSEDLKVGVGAGLRYLTALGPIRLDAAVPLDPETDDPDFAFYVGIGQAF